MGYFVIVLTTIIILFVIALRQVKRHNGLFKRFFKLIKDINKAYIEVFYQGKLINIGINVILIIFAEIFTFIYISTAVYRYIKIDFLSYSEPLIKGIIAIVIFIVVYYLIGYFLLFSSKIHGFIRKTEDKEFKIDFILSYFIISTYLAVMLIFPNEFKRISIIALVGVVVGYLLNLKLLFGLMINPMNVKSIKDEDISFGRIMIAALLILVMLVLNLYLAVCIVNGLDKGAYTNTNGYFSLFYYTIITFTTIGYGDIVPVTMAARAVAIIISITSVVCLTIFLSSILSYREKFNFKND